MRPTDLGATHTAARASSASRAAITLVEMLVAMAITLLLMATVVQVFDLLGTAVASSRSTMEMTDQLRQTQHQLQSDLASISRPVVPWVTDEEGGYFEYVEGEQRDAGVLASGPAPPPPIQIDNSDSSRFSTSGFGYQSYLVGNANGDYLVNRNQHNVSNNASAWAQWRPDIPVAGPYNVTIRCLSYPNRSGAVPIAVTHAGGTFTGTMNQVSTVGPTSKSETFGPFNFNDGTGGYVRMGGVVGVGVWVSADAVTFEWAGTPSLGSADSRLGDADDILLFTARSPQLHFQGCIVDSSNQVLTIESPEAEIVWCAGVDGGSAGDPEIRTVYRRVLLIAPWAPVPAADFNLGLDAFQDKHDLSARQEGGKIVLNSIQDLALRQHRYRHHPNFPHVFQGYRRFQDGSPREGEDVVLRNALAFDARIFDPGAPLFNFGGVGFGPSDPGYHTSNVTATTVPVGFGAFIDLGMTWLGCNLPSDAPSTEFMLPAQLKSLLTRTFDTWPAKYESDGENQDVASDGAIPLTDEGADGFDFDGVGEYETSAPYLAKPQGIEVKLRAYEPDARQIREVTVNQNFAP